MSQWAQNERQENPGEHKETRFHCQSGQTPEHVAQGGHEFSILGDTQNSTGLGFGQLAQAGPAWAGVGLDDLLSSCQPQSLRWV